MIALLAGLLAGCSGSDASGPLTDHEIAAALRAHAAAVRGHDRAAFLAGVDHSPGTAAFYAAADSQFQNLELVPLRSWTYTLAAPVRASGAEAAARRRFGATARIAEVSLHYAIRGADPIPVTESLWWTFARVHGRVVVCSADGLAREGGVSWQGPWDFGPMAVVREAHSLVLGEGGQQSELHRIATTIDQAVPAVTAVWGRRWTRDVVVIVPPTAAALQAALGTTGAPGPGGGEGADVSAVTVSSGTDPVSGQAEGERIVMTAPAFDRLTPLGRRIVLTHEVTHVASASVTGAASPRWLVEGLAEYVANLHTGLSVRRSAPELVAQVARDGIPHALPAETVFDDASTAAAAYEQAWLACRLIARQVGNAGLGRLYRMVGTSGSDSSSAVAHAFAAVLHETPAAFTAAWRHYLGRELG